MAGQPTTLDPVQDELAFRNQVLDAIGINTINMKWTVKSASGDMPAAGVVILPMRLQGQALWDSMRHVARFLVAEAARAEEQSRLAAEAAAENRTNGGDLFPAATAGRQAAMAQSQGHDARMDAIEANMNKLIAALSAAQASKQ